MTDAFEAAGLRCFGPRKLAARLEGSKAFTKDFLQRHRIPTAAYATFTQENFDAAWVRAQRAPLVVKADGLAAGKGVIICETTDEAIAERAGDVRRSVRRAGDTVVIEEFLEGEEASFIAIVSGEHILPLATSQDHKRRDDGDQRPEHRRHGRVLARAGRDRRNPSSASCAKSCEPTVRGLIADGTPYVGFLYAGLMIAPDGTPNVLEFNCRFGDPETQPIMMRLASDLTELCEAALDGRLDAVEATWDPRAALGVVLAAGGYPDSVRKGDVIHGLDAAARLPGKVFHAGTQLDRRQGRHERRPRPVRRRPRVNRQRSAARCVRAVRCKFTGDGVQYRRDIGYRAIAREQG